MMADSDLAFMAAIVAQTVVCLTFARAAFHKLTDFTEFTGFVADYRILPERLTTPASVVIVASEVATVLGGLIPMTRPYAMALGAALFIAYAIAMGVNIRRGRTAMVCGCGGAEQPIGPALLVRNTLLAALATGAALTTITAPAQIGAALIAVAAGALLWVGFVIADQLLSNRALSKKPI